MTGRFPASTTFFNKYQIKNDVINALAPKMFYERIYSIHIIAGEMFNNFPFRTPSPSLPLRMYRLGTWVTGVGGDTVVFQSS